MSVSCVSLLAMNCQAMSCDTLLRHDMDCWRRRTVLCFGLPVFGMHCYANLMVCVNVRNVKQEMKIIFLPSSFALQRESWR
jgi:hypothetical protein